MSKGRSQNQIFLLSWDKDRWWLCVVFQIRKCGKLKSEPRRELLAMQVQLAYGPTQ
jgi:hypothetical protein